MFVSFPIIPTPEMIHKLPYILFFVATTPRRLLFMSTTRTSIPISLVSFHMLWRFRKMFSMRRIPIPLTSFTSEPFSTSSPFFSRTMRTLFPSVITFGLNVSEIAFPILFRLTVFFSFFGLSLTTSVKIQATLLPCHPLRQ